MWRPAAPFLSECYEKGGKRSILLPPLFYKVHLIFSIHSTPCLQANMLTCVLYPIPFQKANACCQPALPHKKWMPNLGNATIFRFSLCFYFICLDRGLFPM